MRKTLILLALAVALVQTAGCANCRRWLHRGSPCVGTQIAAPTMVSAPVAVGTPVPVPQAAPARVVAPVPYQPPQMVVPQQPAVCCPQQVPCCPQTVPCCPAPTMCCPVPCCPPCGCDPCQGGAWFGGFVGSDCQCGPVTSYDEGLLAPPIETPMGSGTFRTDPGPAEEN